MEYKLTSPLSPKQFPVKAPKLRFTKFDLENKKIFINNHEFQVIEGKDYTFKYPIIFEDMLSKPEDELSLLRMLCQDDLWFIVRFVMGIPLADQPWWVEKCRLVQDGPKSNTLDLWPREHGKSSVITVGDNVRCTLNAPNESSCIFSFNKTAAQSFLRQIQFLLESSILLKTCFPDIIWANAAKEAPAWSLDTGLYLKRTSTQKEATFEAFGLIEGMPTGKHFDRRYYDDVETRDLVQTPDMMQKVKEMFDLSQYLGTIHGINRVAGTYYHYEGPLVYIGGKKKELGKDTLPEQVTNGGEMLYTTRRFTATIDGSFNGPSAYLPESRLVDLRTDKVSFATQMLLEPSPVGAQKLHAEDLKMVRRAEVPKRLFKFILIDCAGTEVRKERRGDDWAIYVVGVAPVKDEVGISDVYILDMVLGEYDLPDVLRDIVALYKKHGRIRALGVEKAGLSSAEIHITNALKAEGISISEERGNLVLLRPAGRKKQDRVLSALTWPLSNGKIHICQDTVPAGCVERLKMEMARFPFWRDDALDALSYLYDLLKDYRFPLYLNVEDGFLDVSLERKIRNNRDKNKRRFNGFGWMA